MSRPKSGSKKGAKKLTPKQQIAQLTDQNSQLTQELETLRSAHEQTTLRLTQLVSKMIGGVDLKQFHIRDPTNVQELGTDILLQMIESLIVKKRMYDKSVESRVEEVETRLTQMSMDLARSTKKTLAYEQGLEDLLQCPSLHEVQDKVYQLQLIAGQKFHEISAAESFQNRHQVALLNSVQHPDSNTIHLLENAVRFNLHTPNKRLPGETHIAHMQKELSLYLVKELSVEKVSGADWRMLAERVGIPEELIKSWKQQHLSCPMGKVLTYWGQSDGATVRMLHRHLMSPQMRQALLAKRLSDFYDVD